ncbi:hypothetical protein [Bacillus sp. BP-3]|uniref:hypothetical protein n=1 Tax=Bacillus sp. BP-3 TaxID=3022773 RepID=UPI00232B82E9|nr:hypothetical protein [Bacillus sp. BP-3]MDC2865992.1 hypothetical protein [Bacillus sp. BP-3]
MMYPYNYSYNSQNAMRNFKNLIGTNVSVNLGGPEKGEGTLLKIQSDFCVVQTNDGVVYYPLHHINGFAEQYEDDSEESDDNEQNNNQNNQNEDPIIVSGTRFGSVINRLKGETVQLNQGPKKIEGTVVGRTRDHILLEVDGQVTYVPAFHVQSMRWNYNNDNNNDDNNNNNENNNNDNNNDDNETRNQDRKKDECKRKKCKRRERRCD